MDDHSRPYSPAVDEGVVRVIYDYEGRWPVPDRYDLAVEDDYSEDSFA